MDENESSTSSESSEAEDNNNLEEDEQPAMNGSELDSDSDDDDVDDDGDDANDDGAAHRCKKRIFASFLFLPLFKTFTKHLKKVSLL